jgi:anti-sigma factor RsiW
MDIADRILWQRSRGIDAPENEAERYLDLAAFAEGRLDADERERIEEWLQRHPDAAADIAAARALAAMRQAAAPETIVARACALLDGSAASRPGTVIPFRPRFHTGAAMPPVLARVAQWGSLVAALVVAGWLGFTLGMDASGMLARSGPGIEDGIAQDLLGSSPAFFRDLTGGA